MTRNFDKPINRERTVKYCMHALLVVACCLSMILGDALFPNDANAWDRDDKVVVQVESGKFLNVRVEAGTNNAIVGKVPNGTKGTIRNGPKFPAAGLTWYEVSWETSDRLRGWCAESYDGCVYLITPERAMQKDRLVEKLFGFEKGTADAKTKHDYNGYRCNLSWRQNGRLVYAGGHAGWDVTTRVGTDPNRDAKFYAVTEGELIRVGGTFNTIAIYDSENDKTTLYAHASEILVSVEDNPNIKVGDLLGRQGATGPKTTGPHVHIEVRKGRIDILAAGADGSQSGKHPTVEPVPYLYKAMNRMSIPEPPNGPVDTIVHIAPASVESPRVNQELALSLEIEDGERVFGYQATIAFDKTALRYISSANGDYLSGNPFFKATLERNIVTLVSTAFDGESNGDGTLATLLFEVVSVKNSAITITEILLSDGGGKSFIPNVKNAEVTEPKRHKADVNGDGTINIQDLVLVASNFGRTGKNDADVNNDGVVNIQDLVLVAANFGSGDAAPSMYSNLQRLFTVSDVQHWLSQANQFSLTDATSRKGIRFLEQLLAVLTPKQTVLLHNYPNPFNPETWIPYQLAEPADVTVSIYSVNGKLIRKLTLGHQPVGVYKSRSRAAYWDGRNALGEPVANGVYFYTLTAGNFTATRKMLIRK